MSLPVIIGHRGAKGELPENTLPGFYHAVRNGIRDFEFDLHLSRDGEMMVIHDSTLDRTTGMPGNVWDFTAQELSRFDARKNTAPSPVFCGVPRLQDVLTACGDYRHLQLEVKSDRPQRLATLARKLAAFVKDHQLYDRVTVTSSDIDFLRLMRRRDNRMALGYVAESRYPSPVTQARHLDASLLVLNWRLATTRLVNEAHAQGMQVSCWTVNRIHDMVTLNDMGVDSIITDYPTSALHYFQRRYPGTGGHRLSLGTHP